MSFATFALLVLAAFRISRLLIEDTITEPLRSALFRRWPGQDVKFQPKDQGRVRGGTISIDGDIYASEPGWVGDRLASLLSCYACTGFWVSLALYLLWYLAPVGSLWVIVPFAISGGVWLVAVAQDWFDKADE